MNFILITQLIISILLISSILLQAQGTGLGGAWGGEGKSYHSKRGLEKVLFRVTLFLGIAFIFSSLLSLV